MVVSLFLTTAVVGPLAWWGAPHAVRWRLMGKLTSSDLAERQRGLNYVIRRAGDRPGVLDGAIRQAIKTMDAGDQENFLQIANALQLAGKWRRPPIPTGPWLYWIEALGADPDAEARIMAAQQVGRLRSLAGDPRLAEMLREWLDDDDGQVRYNALVGAAELAGCARDNDLYVSLIADATRDTETVVARQAWIFLGLLGAAGGASVGEDLPLEVAEAAAWAVANTSDSHGPEAVAEPVDEMTALLARLEGTAVGERRIVVEDNWSDTLRLAAVAVTRDPDPADLRSVLGSPLPAVRDAACVVAAERFTPEQNEGLVRSLLTDFSDDAKRSGAILAGLTGLHGDLLTDKMRDEDVWAVRQVHRLGMWMQGRLPEMDDHAPGLLTRDGLPTTTVLLAMLHCGRPEAMDFILAPRADEPEFSAESLNLPTSEGVAPVALRKLLVHYRWHRVLRRYLPDDAPPLWLWADDRQQQLQIDVLRNWYLLNPRTPPNTDAR